MAGDLVNVEYPFVSINTRSTLVNVLLMILDFLRLGLISILLC